MSRLYVIGDVHNCGDDLETLLSVIQEDANDEPYKVGFIGDLIHKGPFMVKTLRLVAELYARGTIEFIIQGNHEDLILKSPKNESDKYAKRFIFDNMSDVITPALCLKKGAVTNVFIHGGFCRTSGKLLDHLDEIDSVPKAKAFFASLKGKQKKDFERISRVREVNPETGQMKSFDIDNIQPGNWPEWFVRTYTPPSYTRVVYGHEPHVLPRLTGKDGLLCLGIDTGCVYGNGLTAIVITETENYRTLFVPSVEKYKSPLNPVT